MRKKPFIILVVLLLIPILLNAKAVIKGTGKVIISMTPPSITDGLVGYWTFDGKDMAGGKALDKSGNGNHGSPVSIATSTFYTSGKIGQGLKFDGVDDKVTVPLTATLNPSSITVAFWANVPSYIGSTNNAIVELGSSVNNFRVRDTSGKWQLLTNGAVNTLSGTANSLAYNQWIHWVFIANSSGLSIYKNGVLNASNAIAYTAGANAIWNLGSSGFYNRQTLDDVRIYNRALSATEIRQLYNIGAATKQAASPQVIGTTTCSTGLSCGLVGYWTFDGKDTPWTSATAATALDKSGNGNTGTLTNMSQATSPTIGKIGQGLKFDGVDDIIEVTQSSSINDPLALTVSVWAKQSTLKTNGYYISKADNSSGGHGWSFGSGNVANSSLSFVVHGFTTTDLSSISASGVITTNSWNHYVVTWDGSNTGANVRMYKNGVEVSYATQTNGGSA